MKQTPRRRSPNATDSVVLRIGWLAEQFSVLACWRSFVVWKDLDISPISWTSLLPILQIQVCHLRQERVALNLCHFLVEHLERDRARERESNLESNLDYAERVFCIETDVTVSLSIISTFTSHFDGIETYRESQVYDLCIMLFQSFYLCSIVMCQQTYVIFLNRLLRIIDIIRFLYTM